MNDPIEIPAIQRNILNITQTFDLRQCCNGHCRSLLVHT
jgi:hypothetical protein